MGYKGTSFRSTDALSEAIMAFVNEHNSKVKPFIWKKSVPEASKDVGVVKAIAYEWLRRWNESGYEGLIPRFAGGKPGKLSKDQKEELKSLLKAKDLWYLGDIVDLIRTKFNVEYSERQVRRILKSFKMNHAKPYQIDYRKPDDADEKLKKN